MSVESSKAQLYLEHATASVTRPVRRLVGFHRVFLAAGSEAHMDFDVHADITSFTGHDGRRRVEPGIISLTASNDAGAEGLTVTLRLEGSEPRHVNHPRIMDVPVTVTVKV